MEIWTENDTTEDGKSATKVMYKNGETFLHIGIADRVADDPNTIANGLEALAGFIRRKAREALCG